jgi:Uma2 family endonuclease
MTTVLEPTKQVAQRVILQGISWQTYERLLAECADSHAAHFNYDDGVLEIMVLSFEHERLKHLLALLVEVLAGELGVDTEGAGSTTFRRQDLAKGFEPDASFYFQHAARVRGLTQLDLTNDPAPELIIEVDITNPSLDKFPIFAALGVAEVWRCETTQVQIFRLTGDEYVAAAESALLPRVTGALVTRLLESAKTTPRNEWRRLVRESVAKGGKQ